MCTHICMHACTHTHTHTHASLSRPSAASCIVHLPCKPTALHTGCRRPSSFPLPLVVLWRLGHRHTAPWVSRSRCPQPWRAECELTAGPLQPASGRLPVKAVCLITEGPGVQVVGQNLLPLHPFCCFADIMPKGQTGTGCGQRLGDGDLFASVL